ncbi:hypothetical protein WDV13_02635 [Weissella cibaria]|jgi:hypothetical protein|uniref:hypothetical protein n=1 Tax=Weissella cibaria TaxID=137591 RepID=UPI0011C4618B|nr:hypothetical protein [Weissella cibaria]MCQ9620440.1 hypothetical protein [Weissella cibaria]
MLVIVFLLLVLLSKKALHKLLLFVAIALLVMIGLALLSPFLGFVLLVVAVLAISWVIILLRKKIHDK